MTPETFLAEFGHFADAPNGVQKLRVLILRLAVQGRFTEKERNPTALRTEPAELPEDWHFAALTDVAEVLDAQRIPINKAEREARIAGKEIEDLYPYYGATQQAGWIDDYIFDEELVLLGEDGVPFLDPYRPKAYLISGQSWVNNHAHVLRGIDLENRFLVHCLNVCSYEGLITGTTRMKLNQARMKQIQVPVPPLAEQKRIVAKVDQLMALCDELEARKQQQRAARVRCNHAALDALLHATDPEEFATHWQRIGDHFDLLYDHPETIAKLRAAILQLAVQGKLVPQDPGDEPATELLIKIESDKTHRTSPIYA